MQNYAFYGKSSKRNSNDVVGHLGVGCKSAFAYTDTFTITSIHEGIKSLYSATKDATGYKIYCLNSEPSDEPSGIEISIYVNPSDVSLFVDNAFKFFKHFNPRPNFINNNYINSWIDAYQTSKLMDAGKWIVYSQKSSHQNSISVVMGNICYPVNLENIQLESNVSRFLDYWKYKSIVLFANIGDISHASTRENLKYDNKTKEWLVDAISRIPQDASELSQKFLSECTNLWQAKVLYHNLISTQLENGLLNVQYDGHDLSKLNSFLTEYRPSKALRYNHGTSRWEAKNNIPAWENTVVFYAKGDITFTSVMPRLQNYIKLHSYKLSDHQTYIVFFKNPENAQKFIDSEQFDGCEMIDLASCPYIKPSRSRNIVSLPAGSILEFNDFGHYYHKLNSDHWKVPSDIPDNELKYYLVISHYQPTEMKLSMSELYNLSTDIKLISNSSTKLYGVKKSEVSKLDDSWVNIKTYFNIKFQEMCRNQEFMNYLTHKYLFSKSEQYRTLYDFKSYDSKIPDNHPVKEFLQTITPYLNDDFSFNRLKRYIFIPDTKDDTLYEKQMSFIQEFFSKYYMLKHVTIDNNNIQDILEYTKSG